MLGNLGTRLCLGCLEKTSQQILGNPEAKTNFGQKGRLIINNNPAIGSIEDNVHLRTPFLPDIQIGKNWIIYKYMEELNKLGKIVKPDGFYTLSFYDEQRFDYEKDFLSYITGKANPAQLYLGEPSFVLHNPDGEKWLRIELTKETNENILIFSPIKKNREKFLKMLFYNFLAMQSSGIEVQHSVLYSDKSLHSSIGFDALTNCQSVLAREYTSPAFSRIKTSLWRKLFIEVDELAFGSIEPTEDTIENFKLVDPDNNFPGELWLKRAQAIYNLFGSASYQNAFGLKGATGDTLNKGLLRIIKTALIQFRSLNCDYERLDLKNFKEQFIWLIGLEGIIGLGADYKMQYIEELKGIMREAPEYKVHFILSTSTMEDTTTLRSVLTHTLCANLLPNMVGNIKATDDYPDNCADILGIYFNSSWESNKCRKFKKIKFEGEL